jgi:hypothetical protein
MLSIFPEMKQVVDISYVQIRVFGVGCHEFGFINKVLGGLNGCLDVNKAFNNVHFKLSYIEPSLPIEFSAVVLVECMGKLQLF